MGCEPQRVTAYVDRELSEAAAAEVARHLAACAACGSQASFEMDLSARLRALPADRPSQALAARILAEQRAWAR